MTDIVLIKPNFQYGELEEAAPSCPPLGLASIAAYLELYGYKVKIIEANAERLSVAKIAERVKEINPKFVGITAVTAEFPSAKKIAQAIKEVDNKIVTILGGPHPTIMPFKCQSDFIDYLVVGEGEVTALDLLDHLSKGEKNISEIDGLAYKDNGKLVMNKPRKLIENLDELPFPAYHLLPMELYKAYAIFDLNLKFASLITSRGCPYMCTYCTSSQVFGKRWRAMSGKRTFEMMKMLYDDYGIRHFYFQDDEFTINKARVFELCDTIIKENLHEKIVWECLSRVFDVNDALLKKMYEAGCRGIVYGVELGYDEGLKKIKKSITLEQALLAIKLTKKHGIHARASFMMGFPWESEKEIKQTIKFAKKLAPDIAYFQVLIPYPGTPLFDEMKREGLIIYDNLEQYVQHSIVGIKPVIKTRHLSNDDLSYWNGRAFLSFYLSPKTIFNRLVSKRGGKKDLKRTITAGYGLIRNSLKVILRSKGIIKEKKI